MNDSKFSKTWLLEPDDNQQLLEINGLPPLLPTPSQLQSMRRANFSLLAQIEELRRRTAIQAAQRANILRKIQFQRQEQGLKTQIEEIESSNRLLVRRLCSKTKGERPEQKSGKEKQRAERSEWNKVSCPRVKGTYQQRINYFCRTLNRLERKVNSILS